MTVTNEMLMAKVKNAVRAGILPASGSQSDTAVDKELMLDILDAALSVDAEAKAGKSASQD